MQGQPPPSPPRTEPLLTPLARLLLVLALLASLGFAATRIVPDLAEEDEGAEQRAGRGDEPRREGEDGGKAPAAEEIVSSAGLDAALGSLRGEVGGDVRLIELVLGPEFGTFEVFRDEDRVDGYRYAGDDGELTEVDVVVVTPGPLEAQTYPLRAVEPPAVERIITRARRASGSKRLVIQSMVLHRDPIDRRLRWTVSARSGSRAGFTYRADPDGSNFEDLSAGAIRVPEAARDAQRRARCISRAAGDVERILECMEG